jgi:hypothetical protein
LATVKSELVPLTVSVPPTVALLPLTVTALLQDAVLPFVVSKRPLLLV